MNKLVRSAGRIVAGHLLPKTTYPVLRGPLRGMRFVLGTLAGEGGGVSLFLDMFERQQTAGFVRVLQPGQIFFDIGANIGYYTLLASRLVGPSGMVFAFEPSIRNLSWLHRHLTLNKCQNTSVLAAACSDTLTLASFSPGPNFAEGHLDNVGCIPGRAEVDKWVLVPTVTVDKVTEQIGFSPDVMKIDVEGAELAVLHGAKTVLKTKAPMIFLSVHSDELRRSCLEFLTGFGYRALPLNPSEAMPTEYLLSASLR